MDGEGRMDAAPEYLGFCDYLHEVLPVAPNISFKRTLTMQAQGKE